MVKCYREDIQQWAGIANVASHNSPQTLRLLSWNINNLCGMSNEGCSAADVFKVILQLNPDVIVLNEAIADPSPYDDEVFEASIRRVQNLDKLLVSNGYISKRSSTANATLVASRMPLVSVESIDLDIGHEWQDRIRTCVGKLKRDAQGQLCGEASLENLNQHRAALCIELDIGKARPLRVYATHLHNYNYTDGYGSRAAEMATLLQHFSGFDDTQSIIILGDFNTPRKQDVDACVWDLLNAKSPYNDGVHQMLEDRGFRASWDVVGNRTTPLLTHWSSLVVDFIYTRNLTVQAAYVHFNTLSDHLPIVTDVCISQ
eukprot:CAMPEP_0119142022 /NCGR_PEP_ID=MMETSP1310-20130426/31978_1 /TAXON_ID=464262 /ORGANISM="Genus nov. species nov., Strain RCC2339" /LENGTH=315 /DNA_ID=CAMNT_0007133531 /DNA_START=240 /DNA_END=1187 /DNA_ORIENTATION=+